MWNSSGRESVEGVSVVKIPPCPQCGKAVQGATVKDATGLGRFCSLACEIAFTRQTVQVTCSVCGTRFLLPNGKAMREPPFFCSGLCRKRGTAVLRPGLTESHS